MLLHCSNLFFHPYQGELAERLASMSGLDRTFFCNSGTEAMEACLKFARRYWYTAGEVERTGIVALQGAFHGRTMGSLSITADPHYRDPFAPLLADVTFVPPDDAGALRAGGDGENGCGGAGRHSGRGRGAPDRAGVRQRGAGRPAIAPARSSSATRCSAGSDARGTRSTTRFWGCGRISWRSARRSARASRSARRSSRRRWPRRLGFGDHGSTYGGNLLACRAGLFFVGQSAGRRPARSRRPRGRAFREPPARARARARHRCARCAGAA